MKSSESHSIIRLAKLCQWTAIVVAIYLCLSFLFKTMLAIDPRLSPYFIEWGQFSNDELYQSIGIDPLNFTVGQKCLIISMSFISTVVLVWAVSAVYCLFKAYRQGDFFSIKSAGYLRRFAKLICIWVLIDLISEPILTAGLTLQNQVGERVVSVGIGSEHLFALFLALCFMVISHILYRASEIHAENSNFI